MVKADKRILLKAFIAIPLCFVLYSFQLASGVTTGLSVADMFSTMIFGKMDFSYNYAYIMTVENIAFIMLFNLMFSSHISNHFRYSCVYVFSRLRDRKRWYVSRAFEIISTAFVYVLLYIASAVLICMYTTGNSPDSVALYRIFVVFLFSFLIISSSTLLINILSLKWGTGAGFFIVEGILFAFIIIFLMTYNIPIAVSLNPMACLNLFNSGMNTGLITAANNLLLFIVVFFVGMKYVSNYDIAMFDAELN